MKDIILLGAGGHCKSVIDSIENAGEFNIIGILDKDDKNKDKNISKYKILGSDILLQQLYNKGIKNAFICLAGDNNGFLRKKLYNIAKDIGFEFPVIKDKTAIVSKNSIIEEGVFVGKGAVVNSGSYIGKNTIINTKAIIEHDVKIGEYCHVAPGAVLCGEVNVKPHCLIGANSTVIPMKNIDENSIISAGAVIIKDVLKNSVIVGNPGRSL